MDKKAKAGQEASRKTSNVYDDGNIPQSDLPLPDDKEGTSDVIPDEVPTQNHSHLSHAFWNKIQSQASRQKIPVTKSP